MTNYNSKKKISKNEEKGPIFMFGPPFQTFPRNIWDLSSLILYFYDTCRVYIQNFINFRAKAKL